MSDKIITPDDEKFPDPEILETEQEFSQERTDEVPVEEITVEDVSSEEQKKLMADMERFYRLQNQQQFSRPTPPHSRKSRGVGITRKNKASSKEADKLARKQRAVNRKRTSKKSRPTGSRQRK